MYIREWLDVLNRVRLKGKIIADMEASKDRYTIPLVFISSNAVIVCEISSAMLHILNERVKRKKTYRKDSSVKNLIIYGRRVPECFLAVCCKAEGIK